MGVYLPEPRNPPASGIQFPRSRTRRSIGNGLDAAIPSFFVGNYKATVFDTLLPRMGSFPDLFDSAYPVVGDGLFLVELWESSGAVQRIELLFGVLEAVGTEVQR